MVILPANTLTTRIFGEDSCTVKGKCGKKSGHPGASWRPTLKTKASSSTLTKRSSILHSWIKMKTTNLHRICGIPQGWSMQLLSEERYEVWRVDRENAVVIAELTTPVPDYNRHEFDLDDFNRPVDVGDVFWEFRFRQISPWGEKQLVSLVTF